VIQHEQPWYRELYSAVKRRAADPAARADVNLPALAEAFECLARLERGFRPEPALSHDDFQRWLRRSVADAVAGDPVAVGRVLEVDPSQIRRLYEHWLYRYAAALRQIEGKLHNPLYLTEVSQSYFQKGFGLKSEVGPVLARTYQSPVIEKLKAMGYEAVAGSLHFKLAKEFGFCYGVDRAVDYAYQTRRQFPERRVFLSGEIIHNPDVNQRLRDMEIEILDDHLDPVERFRDVADGDVVIMPAFGVSVPELAHLKSKNCVLVDTTCGSVLNVWKKVHYYARDRYTVIIHGKHHHEETRATASQALTHDGGQYLCVRDLEETALVCEFIRGRSTAADLMTRFRGAASENFDPERDLQRIGLANQTTMLMSETLKVQEALRRAMIDRYGEAGLEARFRAFDTICSATQERQDAVLEMLDAGGLDVMIVIGGYNSSNTQALAKMCAPHLTTFHIDSPGCIQRDGIRHRLVGTHDDVVTADWLRAGPASVGITAGASTPDSVVGEVIERVLDLRGHTVDELIASVPIPDSRSTLVGESVGRPTSAKASALAKATANKTVGRQSYA
jgi:4-hydroxy-3-methylbut-2-enyl diphosphate reductase